VFVAVGLALSVLVVRETVEHARLETKSRGGPAQYLSQRDIFVRKSFSDRELSIVSQAGLVNNLNDGMAWGLFPLFFAAAELTIAEIGTLAAIYPAVWGLSQLVDLGYAVGALLAGMVADARGLASAIWIVAGITFASGVVVALRMRETHGVLSIMARET